MQISVVINEYSDLAKIVEKESDKLSCPGCVHNLFERQKNGFKAFYCELGFDQQGGAALRSQCLKLRGK